MNEPRRWKRRPEGSNWGDFGADDQLGRLNLLTPEKVRQGVAEVREGRSFCLSLPLDYPGGNLLNPRRFPPRLRPTTRNGRPNFNYAIESENLNFTDVICDDFVVLYNQYSTQWDALAHAGFLFDADDDGVEEIVYYNGFRGHEDVLGPDDLGQEDGPREEGSCAARALGVEKMAVSCVQGRGVLVDLYHHFGAEDRVVGYDDLLIAMRADGVEVETGDMLCLHTGFADLVLSMQRCPDPELLERSCCKLDGRDQRLLRWITESGIAVLIADNYAVEAISVRERPERCAVAPLHEHCLFKLGIHLGELWHLTPLARWLRAHGRFRFLLTAPPLRLPGAAGSPVTPVATV